MCLLTYNLGKQVSGNKRTISKLSDRVYIRTRGHRVDMAKTSASTTSFGHTRDDRRNSKPFIKGSSHLSLLPWPQILEFGCFSDEIGVSRHIRFNSEISITARELAIRFEVCLYSFSLWIIVYQILILSLAQKVAIKIPYHSWQRTEIESSNCQFS